MFNPSFSVNSSTPPTGVESPANRQINNKSPDAQDAAAFDALMNDPAADFKSKFENLTPAQQNQIRSSLNNFEQAAGTADSALKRADDTMKKLEAAASRGDEEAIKSLSDALEQEIPAAMNALKDTTNSGLAFLDTLEAIDPNLPQALPDFGKDLLALLSQTGGSQEQMNRVATAFGISV